jgi:hypothetical protein
MRTPRRVSAERELFQAATDAARRLKREHRAEYMRNPKGFRETVREAHARVFRLKPGPHSDPRVTAAARERAWGSEWEPLYPRFIDHYVGMPDFTRALAEDGFRRKVTAYLRKHPLLSRKWRKKTVAAEPQ